MGSTPLATASLNVAARRSRGEDGSEATNGASKLSLYCLRSGRTSARGLPGAAAAASAVALRMDATVLGSTTMGTPKADVALGAPTRNHDEESPPLPPPPFSSRVALAASRPRTSSERGCGVAFTFFTGDVDMPMPPPYVVVVDVVEPPPQLAPTPPPPAAELEEDEAEVECNKDWTN